MSPIFSLTCFTGFLALASTGAALPTIDMINNALQRRDIQSPIPGLPGCGISDKGGADNQDPTWAVGKSNWTDGQGHSLGTDCSGGHGDSHCWHEYFLVGTREKYDNWYQALGDIFCDGNGSTCLKQVDKSTQQCKSFEWSVSESISAGFEGEFLKIGAEITATQGQTRQSCNSTTETSSCTWNDGACHSVWAAQKNTEVYGYVRRVCMSPTSDPDANMPNSPSWGPGYYTRGMMDFTVPITEGNAINCRGTCESSYNPGAVPDLPAGAGDLTPWPTS